MLCGFVQSLAILTTEKGGDPELPHSIYIYFTQTNLLMLPLAHASHNTLVSTYVKAQLKQLTQGKVMTQPK